MSDTGDDSKAAGAEPAEEQGDELSASDEASLPPDDSALDQAEIDDLLDISMDDDEPATGLDALVGNTRIQHRRLPLLEACFDRLLTTLSGSLRNFTWEHVELSLADCSSVRFGDYVDAIPMPALISVYEAVEWKGLGLITFDSPLIYSIIDVLLGGRRAATSLAIEGRSFTSIESTLIERVIKLILNDMSAAFDPLCKVAFKQERLESNPSLISIVHPTASAIVFRIDVDMDDRGGRIEILIPDATLEPVRNLLQQVFMGDKFGQDTIWEGHWIREMCLAETEVEVTLGHQMMPLNEIMELKVGSTVQLHNRPGDLVTLTCGGIPLMQGKVGRVGEAVAIQVEDWIAPSRRQGFRTKPN